MTESPERPLTDDDITRDEGDSVAPAEQDADGVDQGQDADTQDHGGGTDTDSTDGVDADGTDSAS
jgi:hypothetical protein